MERRTNQDVEIGREGNLSTRPKLEEGELKTRGLKLGWKES